MKRVRLVTLLCVVLLAATMLTGCKKEPDPVPAPTQSAEVETEQKELADGKGKGGNKADGPASGIKGESGAQKGGKGEGPAQAGTKGEGPATAAPVEETPAPTATPKPTKAPCTHKWKVAETKKPNCTEDGYEVSKCELCGKEKTETLESNGEHDEYLFSESTGTCAQPAEIKYACHTCGSIVRTETGGYGDHSWWVEAQAPTCTEDGGTYAYCQVCGEEKLTTQPATGHNYVDGECTNCGDVAKG